MYIPILSITSGRTGITIDMVLGIPVTDFYKVLSLFEFIDLIIIMTIKFATITLYFKTTVQFTKNTTYHNYRLHLFN